MYPGKPQYFAAQQASQNAQYVTSNYLQSNQQRLAQGYVPNTSLRHLRQETPSQTTANYLPTSHHAGNSLRVLPKQSSIQHSNQVRLPFDVSQSTNPAWFHHNGALPVQRSTVADQTTHAWQQRTDPSRVLLTGEASNVNNAQSRLHTTLSSRPVQQAATRQQVYAGNLRMQQSQVGNVQRVQQPLGNRLVSQPVSSGFNANRAWANSSTSQQLQQTGHMQLQANNLAGTIPLNHLPKSTNRLVHTPVGQANHDPITSGILDMSTLSAAQQNHFIGLQSKQIPSQPEKRDKIHIRFDQKSNQKTGHVQPNLLSQTPVRRSSAVSDTSSKDDEPACEKKPPLVLENKTRIVIDDDIEIVGCKEAEIMSHIRSDCPVHPYTLVSQVDLPPNESNLKRCPKCYCYICDKLALQCDLWSDPTCPHCNANTKSSCWKARRNMKKSPLMNILTSEEIDSDLAAAGELAMKHIVRVRESYITYRVGIPCEFHLVPCECACHRGNKTNADVCAQCKAVHDTKKRFNYDPVRKVVLQIISEIQRDYSDKHECSLLLFEGLLSELCSHRPADFNHMTRMPSNPDPKCQCNTPHIMDEHIEWELVKLFTLHEVRPSFKQKFIKCVNASVQPLQLKDVMKRFMQMRHWDDILLRAVLTGQNTAGRLKGGDTLKEVPLVIEMRVMKLAKEKRYHSILRYLKAVKISKAATNQISDGTPIYIAMDKWALTYNAMQGNFREVCLRLTDSLNLFQTLPIEFVLDLFSLLSGKGLPPSTPLASSFAGTSSVYKLSGVNRTVLLLIYLIFMEVNKKAPSNIACYLWLAKWVNEEKLANNQDLLRHWVQASSSFLEMSRQASATKDCSRYLSVCDPLEPQVILFICSLLVLQFLTKLTTNLSFIPTIIEAYKNNEWSLFYLFSQPALVSCSNHSMIKWLTNFIETSNCSIGQFNQETLQLLIAKNNFADVSLLLKNLIAPNWCSVSTNMTHYVISISAKFAVRMLSESVRSSLRSAEWVAEVIFKQIIQHNLQNDQRVFGHCEVIGKACCFMSIKHVVLYKKLFPPSSWSSKSSEIFLLYRQQFLKNLLSTDEVALFLFYSVKAGIPETVKFLFAHYTEKHECAEERSINTVLMEEVIRILGTPQEELSITKHDIVMSYNKLCAHETLNWLICAKCSEKMPNKWMQVWITIEANGLVEELRTVVQHTLQQFSSWMKELCVHEQRDIQRLLRCLNVFVSNIVKVLIQCKFDEDQLENRISETRFFITNVQLRNEYHAIIKRVFQSVRLIHSEKKTPPKPSPSTNNLTETSHVQTSSISNHNDSSVSKAKTNNAEPQKTCGVPKTPKAAVYSPVRETPSKPPANPRTQIPANDHSSSINNETSQVSNQPPPNHSVVHAVEKKSSDLKLTITRTHSNVSTSSRANEGITSPLASPAFCSQCGDSMTSSFHCAKCHARKARDIKCPYCSEINRDLKGYNCRFCYRSLLEVLTTGETKQSEKSSQKPDVEKKQKKLKKKRSDNSHLKDKHQQPPAHVEVRSPPHPHQSPNHDSSKNSIKDRPRLKTVIQKKKTDQFHLKVTSPQRETPPPLPRVQHHVLSKIPVEDLVPQRPKPHQRAKEAQQKERSLPKATDSPKNSANLFSNLKRDFHNLSDSSDSSDLETPPQRTISPLVLKRKSETDFVKSPEVKKSRSEQSMVGQTTKRPGNQGIAMSKRQRDILHRMKNVGKVKTKIKSPKPTPKLPVSECWEVSKRRKPGPLSRTSYYTIHPAWRVPRHIKIPYILDMPRVCFIHLRPYPPERMETIHRHQPGLKLKRLFA